MASIETQRRQAWQAYNAACFRGWQLQLLYDRGEVDAAAVIAQIREIDRLYLAADALYPHAN